MSTVPTPTPFYHPPEIGVGGVGYIGNLNCLRRIAKSSFLKSEVFERVGGIPLNFLGLRRNFASIKPLLRFGKCDHSKKVRREHSTIPP